MRRAGFAVILIAGIAGAYALGRHNAPAARESRANSGHLASDPAANGPARRVLYYVDPMHPAYKSDRPGIAPDCGMDLEPVYENGGSASAIATAMPLATGAVRIDATAQQLAGIRLAAARQSAGATRVIHVVGRVVPEDTRIYRINSGVDGFIRETFNDAVGTLVKKDQKLASYYAPDFIAAASGFLAASERVPGAVAKEGARSIQNYTDRLRNLGMSDVQIRRLADSRQLPESIDVVAPADGFILSRSITPGQHFGHETEFYSIADLKQVWVAAQVGEQEAPYLRPGAAAQLTIREQGRPMRARVSDSLPQFEAGGGTVKFRLEAQNPRYALRPDMLVDVELPVPVPAGVTVPADALIDTGTATRVYVERGAGVFEPRAVETGWRFGDQVQIVRGLREGENVVASATFLVDSESRIKAAPAYAAGSKEPRLAAARRPAAGHAGS